MKNIVLVVLAVFVLFGCAPKPNVEVKSTKPIEKPMVKEEIEEEPEPQPVEPEQVIIDYDVNKVAVIYPSKIVGKYAKSTINTLSAFLIYQNNKFVIESFDTYDENYENIFREITYLKERGFTNIIAMFTENGFNSLNSISDIEDLKIYLPLIHKSEVETSSDSFIFGGISYKEQLDLLNTISSGKNTMFYVKSYRGNKLKLSYLESFDEPGIIKEINRKANNYKYIMEDENMIGSTVLLNTPIVKSSIILSQLTAYEIEPNKVLSTQVNYTPLLIKLTQDRDREKFFIVNSISEVDDFIKEYTTLLGADITYNWVDYSSLVGVNYLLNKNESNVVVNEIVDNQVVYQPALFRSTSYGFNKVENLEDIKNIENTENILKLED